MTSVLVNGALTQFSVDVFSMEDFSRDFNLSDLKVGNFVSAEVIDYLRNTLLPITDWGCLFQSGGALCDRIVDGTYLRPAYATFARSKNLPYWEYRGACIKGEQQERGEVPAWQR